MKVKDPQKALTRQQTQLAKLRKQQSAAKFAAYPILALVFMILLRMLDDFSTNCNNSLQSSIVNEFFVVGQGMSFQEGLSAMSLATSPLMLLSILATIVVALSDRVGRKPMLLASGLGMAAGTLIIFFSPNFTSYMVGYIFITFFVSFDMHQLYLVEVAPENKRATWQAYATFFSQMAVVSVGAIRLLNTDANDNLAWRNIYLIPAVVGVVIVVMLLFVIRESDVFLKQRIASLERSMAPRQEDAPQVKNADKGGLGKAFVYILKNKQMLWVMAGLLLFRMAIPAFANYNESIMTTSGMVTDAVSVALIFSPIAMGFTRLSAGFVSDKLGRRKASLIYSILSVAGLIAFIFTARGGAPAAVVGIFMGIGSGSYWTVGDQIILMMGESAPTNIRGSVTAASGLLQVVAAIVAMVFAGIMIRFVDLGLFCVIFGTIVLGVATLTLFAKVKETNGVQLS